VFKNIKELGKDSLLYGLGSSLSQFVALFLVPFYSQALSPGEYGVLAMAGLMSQFSNPVLSLGLDNALFRYFSMSEADTERQGYVTTAAILKNAVVLLFLLLFFFCYALLNKFLFQGQLTWEIFLLILASMFLSSIGSLAEVIIRSQRKPKVLLAIQIPTMIIGLAFSVWWVLFWHWGVFGSIAASLATQCFTAVGYSVYIRKYVRLAAFSKERAKTMLHYSLPYIPHRLQAQVMQWFALFMVSQHMGIVIAGIYSMTSKFVKPINLIVDSVQRAWVPYKFQVHRKETNPAEVFRRLISNYWLLLLLIWGGACLIFPYVFEQLIAPKYHAGIYYFPFLSIIPLAQALNYTLTVGIELHESQKALPIGSFYGLLVVLIGSLVSVHFWSPYGPILANAASFCTSAVVIYHYSKKIIRVDFPFTPLLIVLTLESALIATVYCLKGTLQHILGLSLAMLLGATVIKTFNRINPGWSFRKTTVS
jgi:O-antigen/teichoic acid export membrane protein